MIEDAVWLRRRVVECREGCSHSPLGDRKIGARIVLILGIQEAKIALYVARTAAVAVSNKVVVAAVGASYFW